MAAVILGLVALLLGLAFVVLNLINANETLRSILRQLRSIDGAIEPYREGGYPYDEPDMIALLGSDYRLKSDWRPRVEAGLAQELGVVTSRQMTSHELADALAGEGLDIDDPRAVPGDVLQV